MFHVGEIVRMRTGGRKMIVMETLSPNRVKVAWMSKTNIVSTILDQSLLEHDVGDGAILKLLETMMATLDDLLAKANAETTQVNAIAALLDSISAELKAAGQDQAKLDALANILDNQKTAIQAAIVANTPAEPTPVPTPVPAPEPTPTPTP